MNPSPWDKKPNGSRAFDDLLKDSQQRLQSIFGPQGPRGSDGKPPMNGAIPTRVLGLALVGILLLWLASGFFIVNEDEEGIVIRFGKFARIATPGPNYHLPTPFETSVVFPVTRVQREEIGFRSAGTARGAREVQDESLMLTGDENIVEVDFVVQWRINNAQDFAFNVMQPRETVRSVGESAMREVIGKTELADALTGGRAVIETNSAQLMQDILNKYKAGIDIISLQLMKVDPPTAEVISAFRDVQTAEQEKEKMINNARGYRNKILPEARGEVAKRVEKAEAYKTSLVEHAKGESSRFNSVYEEYRHAKEVTKRRLYLETVEEVLGAMDKVIVDSKAGSALPYLPLPMPDANSKIK